MNDNNGIIYREQTPKFVFNGTQYTRKSVFLIQLTFRVVAAFLIILTIQMIFIDRSIENVNNSTSFIIGILVIWIGCLIILYISEHQHQSQLDGNRPITMFDNRILFHGGLFKRFTGKPIIVGKDHIDYIEIIRGRGVQYISKKEGVYWKDSPIGIKIITKSGKIYKVKNKPPSTIVKVIEVLTTQWNVNVEDSGVGMGRGMRYSHNKIMWELPYEEVNKLNLFEYQD